MKNYFDRMAVKMKKIDLELKKENERKEKEAQTKTFKPKMETR